MSAAHVSSDNGSHDGAWAAFLKPFRVDVVPDRDSVSVCPSGEIDAATVGTVRAHVEELVTVGFARVVIDLSDVVFVDSSALHLMVELHAAAREDGWRFAIVPGPPRVQRPFDICGLGELLPFVRAGERV